ncbi:MAG TPA: hypothetical protein VK550_12840 [Polyangiaceae bacterium]|nr:hypothetical protein [Polyangiaceae bacterium]
MRSSVDEAPVLLQEVSAMSTQGPPNPFDRPRMAEALASLKEGLRDTADPLYDGWKLRPRAPQAANPTADLASGGAPRFDPAATSEPPPANAGETIDIAFDGLDETPLSEEPETPRLNDWFNEAAPTQEEELIEVIDEDGVPTIEQRTMSVQADTVRVRVIRYQPFPRWALVIAAALVVFACSVVALRASFPREKAHAARSVLTNELATASPITHLHRAALPTSTATVATSPPTVPPPVQTAAAASVSPPASKTPSSASKRRSGGNDFFRDPGF